MDKETDSVPAFRAPPPPYSATAPPDSTPPVQPIPIPVYVPQTHYHSQHHGYYGTESVVRTHVVTQQPGATVHLVTSSSLFGPNPRTMVCASCSQTVTTKIVQMPSLRTHLCALSVCLIGCWPCAPCIYCMDCCMNVNHYCPNCNSYQGTYISS